MSGVGHSMHDKHPPMGWGQSEFHARDHTHPQAVAVAMGEESDGEKRERIDQRSALLKGGGDVHKWAG